MILTGAVAVADFVAVVEDEISLGMSPGRGGGREGAREHHEGAKRQNPAGLTSRLTASARR